MILIKLALICFLNKEYSTAYDYNNEQILLLQHMELCYTCSLLQV